jgi:hypothetical protein
LIGARAKVLNFLLRLRGINVIISSSYQNETMASVLRSWVILQNASWIGDGLLDLHYFLKDIWHSLFIW